jgi:hypothetical protein
MFIAAKRPRMTQLGLAAVAALAIGTVALPAKARVYASVGVPYGAYYAPYYYYPAPVVSYGPCGWGWHWVPAHWNRWGRWVPGHCRANW